MVRALPTKLERIFTISPSSALSRALGPRRSQEWKPERETSNASHSHDTGQTCRCFAMKANFIVLPSRRTLLPFLGCRAQPAVWRFPCAAVQSQAAQAFPGHGQEKPAADRRSAPSPSAGACSHGSPDPRAAWATLTPRSRISRTASTLNSRGNTRLPMDHLQLHQTPFLGVHETGSRPGGQFIAHAKALPGNPTTVTPSPL